MHKSVNLALRAILFDFVAFLCYTDSLKGEWKCLN